MIREASENWDSSDPVRPFPKSCGVVVPGQEANDGNAQARAEFVARYLIETPFSLEQAAEVLAGEQSSGTFVRVAGETDELRARARARVIKVRRLDDAAALRCRMTSCAGAVSAVPTIVASLKSASRSTMLASTLPRLPRRLRVTSTISANSLLCVCCGSICQRGMRQFQRPRHGVLGTRRLTGVSAGPVIGTIIKPNVGLAPEDTALMVERLCEAGIDFVKDDEVMVNPAHAPLAKRVAAVMRVVNAHADRVGRKVMVAFNVSDETDAMRRNADLVAAAGGTCVMASVNWVGFAALESLRRSTDLAIHGHRNGFAMMSRYPGLGMDFGAYQVFCRLAECCAQACPRAPAAPRGTASCRRRATKSCGTLG